MTSLPDRIWFDTGQASEYTGWSTKTILRALRGGDLHGSQLVTGGRWRIHRDDLDAWQRGGVPPAS